MLQPNVKVSILSAPKISFELFGAFVAGPRGVSLSGKFTAFIEGEYIVIEGEGKRFRTHSRVSLNPADKFVNSFTVDNVSIGKQFHWERKRRLRYEGILKFIIDGNNLIAINILPVEDYLVSVISSEMSSKSSLEFLKAHAIISRGWVLKQLQRKEEDELITSSEKFFINTEEELIKWYNREDHELFDVCSDDHCQRYQGISDSANEQAEKAVQQTRGMVLIHDGELCDTRYSKCCGGRTELFQNVWDPIPYDYLPSIFDYKFFPDEENDDFTDNKTARKWIEERPEAYCNTTDKKILSQVLVDFDQETTDFYRWKVEYTQAELREIIKSKTGIDFGDILSLRAIERGSSGRIISLMVIGSNKIKIFGKELEIRRILSKSHLYSSAFYVTKHDLRNDVPQKFVIHGAGWGHGVGLCQIGAAVMAEIGHKFDEILFHYFKDVTIRRVY